MMDSFEWLNNHSNAVLFRFDYSRNIDIVSEICIAKMSLPVEINQKAIKDQLLIISISNELTDELRLSLTCCQLMIELNVINK